MAAYRTVLVVTGDPAVAAAGRSLGRRGYAVEVTADGADAEARLARELPDLLVVEPLLPGRSGFLLADRARDWSGGRVPVVMVAPYLPAPHRDYAHAAGVRAIVRSAAELAAAAGRLCPGLPGPGRQCSEPAPAARIGRPAVA